MHSLAKENVLIADKIRTLLLYPSLISPAVRLNSFHPNPSTQVFSLESHCKAGAPFALILAIYAHRLLIIPSDSGIRRRLSRLVLLLIRRLAITYSLPYPDCASRMAVAIFSAGLQLSGADVPVRHDSVVPVLRKLDTYGRCEQVPDMRSSYSSGAHPRGTS